MSKTISGSQTEGLGAKATKNPDKVPNDVCFWHKADICTADTATGSFSASPFEDTAAEFQLEFEREDFAR
jgi:hypothetical protein